MEVRKKFEGRRTKYERTCQRHWQARRPLESFNAGNDSTTFGTDKKCELALREGPTSSKRPYVCFD
jgi:hypothetical protein